MIHLLPGSQDPQMTKPAGQSLAPNALGSGPLRDRPNNILPTVPRKQRIIVHGLYKIRAKGVAQVTRSDIENLSAVVKAVVPLGKRIIVPNNKIIIPNKLLS